MGTLQFNVLPSQKQVDMLSSWSVPFFQHLQGILRRDVMLGVARALDPGKQRKFENVSFKGLANALKEERPEVAEMIDTESELLSAEAESIRKVRDKLLAHSDKQAMLEGLGDIPGVSWESLGTLLQAMGGVLNRVDLSIGETQTCFENSRKDGEKEILLSKLQRAKACMFGHNEGNSCTS